MLVLDTEGQRRKAEEWVWAAKQGSRVEFKGPKRSLPQNDLMWALLTEVATQLGWHGKRLSADDWKLMFLDALQREKKAALNIVPNLDNTGFVNLSTSSSDLSKDEMSELIEIIYRDGSKHGVMFHNDQEPASAISPAEGADGSGTVPPGPAANQSAAADLRGEDARRPAEQVQASSPSIDEQKWLVGFARTMVGAIQVDEEFVVATAKGAFIEGLSDETRVKARIITKYALEVCREETTREAALALMANRANCEPKDIAA